MKITKRQLRRIIKEAISASHADRLRKKHADLVTRDMRAKWDTEDPYPEEVGSEEDELEEFREYIMDPDRDSDHGVYNHYKEMFERIKHLMSPKEAANSKRRLTIYGKKTDRWGY